MKRVHHREIVQLGFNQINVVFEWDCMGPCYLASDGAPLRSFNHTVGGQWHNQVAFPWLVQEVKCAGAEKREIKAGEGSFVTALLFSVCPTHWLISIEDFRVRVDTSHAIRLAWWSLLYSRVCCTTHWTLLLHWSLYWCSYLPEWDFLFLGEKALEFDQPQSMRVNVAPDVGHSSLCSTENYIFFVSALR